MIGAGIVGCAIAHELASRGVNVTLVDRRGPGGGATRASAGVLAPQIEGHIPELRRLAARSLALYDRFVERVTRDAGRPVEYERRGTLQVACTGAAEEALAATAAELEVEGLPHTLVGREDARALEPALGRGVRAALLVPQHGYVRAGELTAALVAAAQARGVVLSTEAATGIERTESGVAVGTERGPLACDAVVVATGSWRMAAAEIVPPVRPIRGQLVHLRADQRLFSRVVWGEDCYLVPWRDGSVLVGATVEDVGFDERSTAEGVRQLLAAALDVVPGLRHAAFQEVRVGLRPLAAGELPVIGRSPALPEVVYALGHYRNGVLLAPLTASLVADLVLEGREQSEPALAAPSRDGQG